MEMSKALAFQKMTMGSEFYGVTDCSQNGVCSRCGSCCADILPLLSTEIVTLRNFVKKNNYKANTRVNALMVNPYDGTCPFLNKDCGCDVYEIRPEICRLFKCWDKNPATAEWEVLPKEVKEAFLKYYRKNPIVSSIRKEVFGQEVPF